MRLVQVRLLAAGLPPVQLRTFHFHPTRISPTPMNPSIPFSFCTSCPYSSLFYHLLLSHSQPSFLANILRPLYAPQNVAYWSLVLYLLPSIPSPSLLHQLFFLFRLFHLTGFASPLIRYYFCHSVQLYIFIVSFFLLFRWLLKRDFSTSLFPS